MGFAKLVCGILLGCFDNTAGRFSTLNSRVLLRVEELFLKECPYGRACGSPTGATIIKRSSSKKMAPAKKENIRREIYADA